MTNQRWQARLAPWCFLLALCGCSEQAVEQLAGGLPTGAGAGAGGMVGSPGGAGPSPASAGGIGGGSGSASTPARGGMSGSSGSGGSADGSAGAAGQSGMDPSITICGDQICELTETCENCSADCGTCQALPSFGNTDIHPQKLDIYMSPDIDAGWFDWQRTGRSLAKYHQLLPHAWIRWDNETGHNTSTPENVEHFVSLAHQANVPMIITASAVDGYDNFWALNFGKPPPEEQVTITIRDIADGPYLEHAYGLLKKYPNVKFVETINEPDGIWFVGDYDNADSWAYYLDKLSAATGGDHARILGPATAFRGSKIYNFHAARSDLSNFSYHTYSGWEGLHELGDKAIYVTEYGYKLSNHATPLQAQSPALNLADLWQIEKNDKLDGKIERVAYVYLHTMMLGDQHVGDHHGFTGFFLALASYSALGRISKNAYLDPAHPDFIASDDGQGHFGLLLWNTSETATLSNQARSIPNVSAPATAKLYALRLTAWGSAVGGECRELGEQPWLSVQRDGATLNVNLLAIPALEAVYLSTEPCQVFVD
jgi:hypothetical protein